MANKTEKNKSQLSWRRGCPNDGRNIANLVKWIPRNLTKWIPNITTQRLPKYIYIYIYLKYYQVPLEFHEISEELPRDYLGNPYEIPHVFPGSFPKGFLGRLPKDLENSWGFPRRFPRNSPGFSQKVPRDSLGIPQEFPGNSLADSLGVREKIPWGCPKDSKGIPCEILWGFLRIARRFPRRFPNDFHGIP